MSDPMDLDMDYNQDGGVRRNQAMGNVQHHNHCQQPQLSANVNAFTPLPRDGQHYDPVHDTSSGWFQPNTGNPLSRSRQGHMPTEPARQQPARRSNSFVPSHASHTWENLGGPSHPYAIPGPGYSVDLSSQWNDFHHNFNPIGGSFDYPWNQPRESPFTPTRAPSTTAQYPSYRQDVRRQSNQSENSTSGRAANSARQDTQNTPGPLAGQSSQSGNGASSGLDMETSRAAALEFSSYPSSLRMMQAMSGMGPTAGSPTSQLLPSRYAHLEAQSFMASVSRQRVLENSGRGPPDPPPAPNPVLDSSDEEEETLDLGSIIAEERRAAATLFADEEEVHYARLRGVLGGKKVVSRAAMDTLEKVNLGDLKESDKTCIICYNEFGVKNPEGILENPLRLPKCKHIFGDVCIKKWFEDSDSCPYCRDKLPSELANRRNLNHEAYRQLRRQHMLMARQSQAATLSYMEEMGYPGNSDTQSQRRGPTMRDEYGVGLSASSGLGLDSWAYSPPSRSSPGESENRRRQPRGRVTRAVYSSGRTPSTQWQYPPNAPRRTYPTTLPTSSNPPSIRTPTHPAPRIRPSAISNPSGSSLTTDSPPVAFGSGLQRAASQTMPGTDSSPATRALEEQMQRFQQFSNAFSGADSAYGARRNDVRNPYHLNTRLSNNSEDQSPMHNSPQRWSR